MESQLKLKDKAIQDLKQQITTQESELHNASKRQHDLETEKREYVHLLEQERMVAQDTAASLSSNQEKLALVEEELQEKSNSLKALEEELTAQQDKLQLSQEQIEEKDEAIAGLTAENAAQLTMIDKLHNELKEYDEENKTLGERLDVLEASEIAKDRRIKELESEVQALIEREADNSEKGLEIAELKRQLDLFMRKEEDTRRNELEERALLRKQFESTKEEFQVRV
jgi:chromosome segregation ATPase